MIKRKHLAVALNSTSRPLMFEEAHKRYSVNAIRPNNSNICLLQQASTVMKIVKEKTKNVPMERTSSKLSGSTRMMSYASSPHTILRHYYSHENSPDDISSILQAKNKQIQNLEAKLVECQKGGTQMEKVKEVIRELREEAMIFTKLLDKADRIIDTSKVNPSLGSSGYRPMSQAKKQLQNITTHKTKAMQKSKAANITIMNPMFIQKRAQPLKQEGSALDKLNELKGRLKKVLTNSVLRINGLKNKRERHLGKKLS